MSTNRDFKARMQSTRLMRRAVPMDHREKFPVPDGYSLVHVTAEDFSVRWNDFITFHFYEDTDASGIYAYGHVNKSHFAEAVNNYDAMAIGMPALVPYIEENVTHLWAVAIASNDKTPDDWQLLFTSKSISPAFPVSLIAR